MGQGGCKAYNNPQWCMCKQRKQFDKDLNEHCRDGFYGCACRQCLMYSAKRHSFIPLGAKQCAFLQPHDMPTKTGATLRGEGNAPRLVGVAVRVGSVVDQVIFGFADRSVTFRGKMHGGAPQRWNVQEGDHIVEIRIRVSSYNDRNISSYFIHDIQFITARGAVSKQYASCAPSA